MNLNVNSPAYYSHNYFIDNEVYRMCQSLQIFMKDKEYSEVLKVIGILPVIAPEEVLKSSPSWKEGVKFLGKNEIASICIQINFSDYHSGDSERKKKLMLEAVIRSVERVAKKPNIRFNLGKFKEDISYFLRNKQI